MPDSIALFAFLATLAFTKCIKGENIVRHAFNNTQATFYKVASNYAMNDDRNISRVASSGLTNCIDFCVEYTPCKAFNYKAGKKDESNCELLQKDQAKNAQDIVPRPGWSFYDTGHF